MDLTPRRVRAMCMEGQIEGAAKLGREWAVPIDAVRPCDGRITTFENILDGVHQKIILKMIETLTLINF